MSLYSEEQKQEHLAITRRVVIRNPNVNGYEAQRILEKAGYKLNKEYVYKILAKIRDERTKRYDRHTKEIIIAEFDDFINDLEPKLREIIAAGEDNNKIQAIRTLVKHKEILLDKMMDMGLLERQIGSIEMYDMANIAKLVKEANERKNNTIISK